jgi:hypothetical protein
MVRKKRTIAKSRAASLKGWRTKQRMQEARSMPTADDVVRLPPPWDTIDIDQTDWPAYMRRALPNPWLAK